METKGNQMVDLDEPSSQRNLDSGLIAVSAACVSTVVLSLGILHSLSPVLQSGGHKVGSFVVDSGALWVSMIGAVVGRLISIWIQSEVVVAAAGAAGRQRTNRLGHIQAVLRSQLPVAVGDLTLGLLGIFGLVGFKTLVSLAMSPLSPFLVWSVVVFISSLRSEVPGVTLKKARLRALIAFIGFLYFARLMIFLVSLMPKG